MAQGLNRLTDLQIKAAAPGTSLADGGGLLYRATAKGLGKFAFKFTSPDLDFRAAQAVKGSKSIQREMGLGAYPATRLPAARAKAAAARELLAKKIDPIEDERRTDGETRQRAADLKKAASEKAMTFGRYADEHFLPFVLPGFSNKAHIQQWEATFKVDAKDLRNRALTTIVREDVLAILRPIWDVKNVTAARARRRIARLFAHAIQNGHYSGINPASWEQFDATLSPPQKLTKGSHSSLPYAEIAKFIVAVRAKQAESTAALMVEWISLTACRTGDARFATWEEIDLQKMLWIVPAKRMKTRKDKERADHVVPITTRMAEILAEAKCRSLGGAHPADFVFVGPKGKHLSEMAALMVLRGMPEYKEFTVHGLRATFKSWARAETEFPSELSEEQLAHVTGEVERSYVRVSAHERRRRMMEQWAAVCAGETPAAGAGNVVLLRKAGEPQ